MYEDPVKVIEECLEELMEPEDEPADVNTLAEELKQEYPIEYKLFITHLVNKYKLSACGAHFVHVQGLMSVMDRWLEENKVRKIVDQGKILWQKL